MPIEGCVSHRDLFGHHPAFLWVQTQKNRHDRRCGGGGLCVPGSPAGSAEPSSFIHRLIQYIERESLRRTFSSVAEDVGVDEKTVRNIFNDYCERLEKTLNFKGSENSACVATISISDTKPAGNVEP